MVAQVLFSDVFFEKGRHLNAVRRINKASVASLLHIRGFFVSFGKILLGIIRKKHFL